MPRLSRATAVSALMVLAMLAGALVWFKPYLTEQRGIVAAIPDPPPLDVVAPFAIPPGGEACLAGVTFEPDGRTALLTFGAGTARKPKTQTVKLVLSAPGYRSVSSFSVPPAGGQIQTVVQAPARSLMGTACLQSTGTQEVTALGTTEGRTVSRTVTTIGGHAVPGDITLAFYEAQPSTLLDKLGTIFERASAATDHLLPAWLIWTACILCILGIPLGVAAALFLALREDRPSRIS